MLPTVTIIPQSVESLSVLQAGSGAPTSAAWSAANRALFIPFRLSRPITAVKMFVFNGTTVSGNLDVGIYNKDGVRLVSSGSVAQAGTSQVQVIDIADTFLDIGLFYMAMAMDNSTGHNFRRSVNNILMRLTGCLQMASAFPLPATATFASISSSYVPTMGLTTRTTV